MSLSVTNQITSSSPSNLHISGQGKYIGAPAGTVTYGVQYGSTNPPTSYVAAGSSILNTVTYNWNITVPSAGTWYVRAYAHDGGGYYYASVQSVVVHNIPLLTTTAISSVNFTTASGGGDVVNAGQGTVSSRGVCWNTSSNPTTANSHTVDGSGTGVFSSSLTSLTPGILYYVRAYAVNQYGTGYGSETTFTTLSLPVVTTVAITNIYGTGATGGGNVTSQGTDPVTAKGVCYGTSLNPTTADTHTIDGSGVGSFVSTLSPLGEDVLYHVRAYATNSLGTGYGSDVQFTSSMMWPVITVSNDTSQFPNIGWSGYSTSPSWTGATHIRWWHKETVGGAYVLLATTPIGTLTHQQLGLKPNVNYYTYAQFYSNVNGHSSPGGNNVTTKNNVSAPDVNYSSILII